MIISLLFTLFISKWFLGIVMYIIFNFQRCLASSNHSLMNIITYILQHNTTRKKTEKIFECEYNLVSQYCNIIFFISVYRTISNGCVMTRIDSIKAIASNLINGLCFDTILDVIVCNKNDVVFASDHVTLAFVLEMCTAKENSGRSHTTCITHH